MTIRKPGPRVVLLTALLLTLAAGLRYRAHLTRDAEVRRMASRLEQLEGGNERARSLVPEEAARLARRLESHADRIASLERLIPRSEEVPALLESLAAEARRSGLGDLAFIRPGEDEPNPFYTSPSYEISVDGGYHEVARFLTAIASLPRIVTPVGLEMTAVAGPGTEPDSRLRAHFWIETYVRPPGAEDAGPAPTGSVSGPRTAEADLDREVFFYPGGGLRDPFQRPLPGDPAGPGFEELRLIGVVLSADPRESVALVGAGTAGALAATGAGARTFRLRQDARVGNMRVVRVGQDHLVLEINRFGEREQLELRLERRGRDGR